MRFYRAETSDVKALVHHAVHHDDPRYLNHFRTTALSVQPVDSGSSSLGSNPRSPALPKSRSEEELRQSLRLLFFVSGEDIGVTLRSRRWPPHRQFCGGNDAWPRWKNGTTAVTASSSAGRGSAATTRSARCPSGSPVPDV